MSSKMIAVTCWLMMFAVPVAVMAVDMEPAMLSAQGAVLVNGKTVPLSTPVFPGDQITTGKDANATVITKGTTIVLPAESVIKYGDKRIQMEQGRVVVVAQPGTEARLGNLTITPSLKPAKFQLYQKGTDMGLATLEGEVNVTDGVDHITLPAGEMMTHASTTKDTDNSTSGANSTVVIGSPPAAASGAHHIAGWIVTFIVAAAIGGIVVGALVWEGVIFNKPASPTKPTT
jgi:hypothetical protein